jgi:two-component system nitrogen regulation response regulator GlnG
MRQSQADTQGNETRAAQVTILVVDDDEAIRSLIHEALGLFGYRVVAVGAWQEAEDLLQRPGPGAISLVITDVHLTADLQAQEGYVFYQRWTARSPTLPFLLISGAPASQALPAVRTGAVYCLSKPFSIDELRVIVCMLLKT